jgi:hypothetical protein
MRRRPLQFPSFGALVLSVVALGGCLPHTAWLGGADHERISEEQAPLIALIEFRKAHRDATIDWIEGIFSNGPAAYCVHFRDGSATDLKFVYRNFGRLSDMGLYPRAVKEGFERIHPDGAIDLVESFDDMPSHAHYFRLHYHLGPAWVPLTRSDVQSPRIGPNIAMFNSDGSLHGDESTGAT